MALDPKKWTLKTQEAIGAAVDLAKGNSNPELTPDHLLAALARQDETIVPAVLTRLGQAPLMVRNRADEAVARLPKAYGGDEPRLGREINAVFDEAQRVQSDLRDDFLSVEHLLLAMSDRLGVDREEMLARSPTSAARTVSPRRTPRTSSRRSSATARTSPPAPARARSTRSSAATTRSAASSRCCRGARRTTPC